jgi:hypothetical protein
MKKNKKQKNKENAENDLLELDALGFEVIKFTDWHWRINKPDYEEFMIDVWPTRNKLMSLKDYKTEVYQSLLKAIEDKFKSEVF